jgi:hypothetical protein
MTTQPNPVTPSPARGRGNDRRPIAAYDSYREAERAVDYLSDNGFPVQRVAIVGSEVADQAQALLAKMSGAV